MIKGLSSILIQKSLGIEGSRHLDPSPHQSRPACLVAGPKARSILCMEIFKEKEVVSPVGILMEALCLTKNRAPTHLPLIGRWGRQKDPESAGGNLHGHLE